MRAGGEIGKKCYTVQIYTIIIIVVTTPLKLGFAPASTSISTTLIWPARTAFISGVTPPFYVA